MTTYVIEIQLPRKGLWERFQNLLQPTNLDDIYRRNATRLEYTPKDSLADYMAWKVIISDVGDFEAKNPFGESVLKSVCDEIEAGTYSPPSLWLNVRLGQHEGYLEDREQLYVDLVIHPRYLQKPLWCDSEYCLISMYLPTRNTSMRNQDRNFIRPLLGMVFELLNPTFAFSRNENTEHGYFELTPPRPIWQFYAETMVFGSNLVEQIGLDHLRKTPAFRLVELEGSMIWISSVRGMGDESFATHYATIHRESKNRTQTIMATDNNLAKLMGLVSSAHTQAVIEHLSLATPRGHSPKPLISEADRSFYEWMKHYWRNAE